MKQVIFIFISLLFLFGCKSIPINYTAINGTFETSSKECAQLIKKIQKNWAVNDTIHCYLYNEKLLKEIMKGKHCFLDKDTSSITSLFGAPREGDRRSLHYNISKDCQEYDDFIAAYQLFFYHDVDKIEYLRFKRN